MTPLAATVLRAQRMYSAARGDFGTTLRRTARMSGPAIVRCTWMKPPGKKNMSPGPTVPFQMTTSSLAATSARICVQMKFRRVLNPSLKLLKRQTSWLLEWLGWPAAYIKLEDGSALRSLHDIMNTCTPRI